MLSGSDLRSAVKSSLQTDRLNSSPPPTPKESFRRTSPRGPIWFECSLSLCYWSNFVWFSLWEPVSLTYCVVGGWMGRILAYAAKGVLFILTNGVAPSGVRAQYFEVYATDMHQKLLLVGFDLSTSRSSPNDIVHRTTLA